METFCTLVVLAVLAGLGIWAFRRFNSSKTTASRGGRDPRWEDSDLRDQDEAARAERTVGPQDITRAEQVIDQFGRSLEDSDAVYLSFAAISRAGGAGSFEETIQRTFHDPGLLDRPWWWLAVVAEHTAAGGQPLIALKVGAFTEMFVRLYLPKLNLAGSMDAGLSSPPEAARARICAATLAALPHLPPQQHIFGQLAGHSLRDGSTFLLTAEAVERYAAEVLTELARNGTSLSPAVLDRARSVLAAAPPEPPHRA